MAPADAKPADAPAAPKLTTVVVREGQRVYTWPGHHPHDSGAVLDLPSDHARDLIAGRHVELPEPKLGGAAPQAKGNDPAKPHPDVATAAQLGLPAPNFDGAREPASPLQEPHPEQEA
jgi:hypothetical protein